MDSEDTSTIQSDLEIDLHEVLCGDCGEPMDSHPCSNRIASQPAVVYKRGTGPRKKPDQHPQCPHCGGRVHWNSGAALVNFECIYRQFLLAEGYISNPHARLPVLTTPLLTEMATWAEGQATTNDFEFGNMASAGGAQYADHREKPDPKPRKEKTPKVTPISEGKAKRQRKKK